MAVTATRKRRRYSLMRKRMVDRSLVIDYKKPEVLKKFITERGKIIPSRVSGATHRQQLAIAQAVRRARYLALIPYSIAHEKEKGFVGEMSEIAQTFAVSSLRRRSDRGFSRFSESQEPASTEGKSESADTTKQTTTDSADSKTDAGVAVGVAASVPVGLSSAAASGEDNSADNVDDNKDNDDKKEENTSESASDSNGDSVDSEA